MKICPRIVEKLILCTDFKCFITRSNGDSALAFMYLFDIDFVNLGSQYIKFY